MAETETTALEIELGDIESSERVCECCGKPTRSAHGFIYRNGDAYAVYYGAWSDGHPDRGVSMAVATGEWDDESTAADRISVGIAAWPTSEEIQFRLLDPEDSPWSETPLLGQMISKEEASSPAIRQVTLDLAEYIVENDDRIRGFLGECR